MKDGKVFTFLSVSIYGLNHRMTVLGVIYAHNFIIITDLDPKNYICKQS